jgi:hypothetical protein
MEDYLQFKLLRKGKKNGFAKIGMSRQKIKIDTLFVRSLEKACGQNKRMNFLKPRFKKKVRSSGPALQASYQIDQENSAEKDGIII